MRFRSVFLLLLPFSGTSIKIRFDGVEKITNSSDGLVKTAASSDGLAKTINSTDSVDEFTNSSMEVHEWTESDHPGAKRYWNNSADGRMQHLDRQWVEDHMDDWAVFLGQYVWKGKKVMDYGIGGGYLGEKLFKWPYQIGSYMGVDISEKALYAAAQVLRPWHSKVKFYLTPIPFIAVKPDIFISQQVIQHFPTVAYLNKFLANVNSCGAASLMLQFRKSKDGKTSANNAYTWGTSHKDKLMALVTSEWYIRQRLPNYWMFGKAFRPMCCGTVGQYTFWQKKGVSREVP